MKEQKVYKGETKYKEPEPMLVTIYKPVELGFKIGFGMVLFSIVATVVVTLAILFIGGLIGANIR